MPHCFGQRARTRDLFSRPFRKHGITPMNKVMLSYRKGDYVDVIADGSVQKGMPFKFYHGKTGVIFDVTKHSVGVVVNKRVGGRIIPKRLQSVSSTSACPDLALLSLIASTRTIRLSAHTRTV